MFNPNSKCLLRRFSGRDKYAQETFAAAEPIGYSPVRLQGQVEKSSVRADSSASRGQAEIQTGTYKILVDKSVAGLRIDDRLEIDGAAFRIASIHPRYRVMGGLDHFEVDLEPTP